MGLLILFAFLAGIITVLSPCILPLLPIILSSATVGGRRRPLGIALGFIGGFTVFTLGLSAFVQAVGISAEALRVVAVIVIGLFGLVLVVPPLQLLTEKLFTVFAGRFSSTNQNRQGFGGGLIIGLSLGALWTPCVGPILAGVISLALAGSVNGSAVAITLAYAVGTAIPLLLIIFGGRQLLARVPALAARAAGIQRVFGVVMIIMALAITFNVDRMFQAWVVNQFPQYGAGLTSIEDNPLIQSQLNRLLGRQPENNPMNNPSPDGPAAPEIIPGGQWFNSQPLTLAALRGKVVLVDFWTYTCINCVRTLPYLKAWDEKYRDKGLVIIGVHTPEFEFEKSAANVAAAIEGFGLRYPIVQDNNYATWNAYRNRYWPAKYFVDGQGVVRATHFGEGDYDESEQTIQELLAELGAKVDMPIVNPAYRIEAKTPELYLGYQRMSALVSPEKIQSNRAETYTAPERIPLNRFAFTGEWTIGGERATASAGATLKLHFSAKDVFLVMTLITGDAPVEVWLDGQPLPTDLAGEDVVDGTVTVTGDRLYHLIQLPASGDHVLELRFPEGGVGGFAFTFG